MTTENSIRSVNDWADFWRDDIGVNVIPANTRKKETYESWKGWQDKPIPQQLHDEWKLTGAFNNGMAIILGKVWHNKQREGLYLIGIDLDNQKAIEEICNRNDNIISLSRLAQWTMTEQHLDDPTKAHILLYSHKPFPKKSSDNIGLLGSNLNAIDSPAIEVKGSGSHGILFVTPSIHKNGHHYQIIGTTQPVIADDFLYHIDSICKKYSISYLDATGNSANGNDKTQPPIEDLFIQDYKVFEGHNRHEVLLRVMESLIARNSSILSLDQIKANTMQWNNQHCNPPLDGKEFEKQWKCATKFVDKSRTKGKQKFAKQGNGKSKSQHKNNEPKPKAYTAYKYSKDIPLAEEIELGNQNVFLQIIDGEPVISPEIDLSKKEKIVIKPYSSGGIAPVIPYVFRDTDEIIYFIEQAKKESIHSLYFKSKSLWKHFVVAKDNDIITLLAMDQVYSYFQDLFATTHYLMIIGSPGSGKGAILGTMKALGYRVVLASDMSGANLLDITGPIERCQVTIAEDEFDDIDTDEVKRKLYKIGYDINGIVPRTLDGNTSARSNRYYYAYCHKIFAAEDPPESKNLAGLNDRTFRIESIKSPPKFRIKTVLDQMQKPVHKRNPKYRDIISKIIYLRKLLLVYRLLHHGDNIEEVPLNIDGRAWELTSPQIFLFNSVKLASSETDKPALQEVLYTLSRFLKKKGEITKKTLEGIVHDALENKLFPTMTAITAIDVNGKNNTIYKISNETICDKVKIIVNGEPSTNPNEHAFYSTDYGKITHKRILKICRDRFSAEQDSIGTGDSKTRALTFFKDIVEKVGKTFEIISEIKIIQPDEDKADECDMEDWDIPFPSQDRPTENTQNHAQDEEIGAMGRKDACSGNLKVVPDEEITIMHLVEREKCVKEANSNNDPLSSENRPISVPTSQVDEIPFKCYYCNFNPNDQEDYHKHGDKNHRDKSLYPNKATLEKHNLTPQGKSWEIR